MGHELGHYLLHDRDGIHVDRRFAIKLRNPKSSEGTDDEEKEANLFAAELLMPKQMVQNTISTVDGLDLGVVTVTPWRPPASALSGPTAGSRSATLRAPRCLPAGTRPRPASSTTSPGSAPREKAELAGLLKKLLAGAAPAKP